MKPIVQIAVLFAGTAVIMTLLPIQNAFAQPLKPTTNRELRGLEMVIVDDLAKGATPKFELSAISDAGTGLFAHMRLTPNGGTTSSFGGGTNMSFPRWVNVKWRQTPGLHSNFEKLELSRDTQVGNYTVEVLNHIPEEVFRYTSSRRGRVIVLRFRIKDDGVLLAWDVQETVKHPSGGRGFVFSLHGGDFPCDVSPYQSHPDCTMGHLEDAPWYNPLWIRE